MQCSRWLSPVSRRRFPISNAYSVSCTQSCSVSSLRRSVFRLLCVSCLLTALKCPVVQEIRHSSNAPGNDKPSHSNGNEQSQSELETLLSEFELDINSFFDHLSAAESLWEGRDVYQDIPRTSSLNRELKRTWSGIRRGQDDISRAKDLLKKEIAEDEWLIVLRS